jgi:hypothetical protein
LPDLLSGKFFYIEALYRILALAVDRFKKFGVYCEKTTDAFFDAIIDTALQCFGLTKNKWAITNS